MSTLSVLKDLSLLSSIVYDTALLFPKDEIYNTTSQMKRAMVSVRLNVREGNVFYDKRKLTHFQRALGSLHEVDECFLMAYEFNWINLNRYEGYKKQYWLCLNKLNKLIQSINSINS